MSRSGGFEDRVSRYETETDARDRRAAARTAGKIDRRAGSIADFQAGLQDMVAYLKKRSAPQPISLYHSRLKVLPNYSLPFTRVEKSVPGWMLSFSTDPGSRRGLSTNEWFMNGGTIICPDAQIYEWSISGSRFAGSYMDPSEQISTLGFTRISNYNFEFRGDDVLIASTYGENSARIPHLDALAAIAHDAAKLATEGLPENIRLMRR
jgi:hypothetical protein